MKKEWRWIMCLRLLMGNRIAITGCAEEMDASDAIWALFKYGPLSESHSPFEYK